MARRPVWAPPAPVFWDGKKFRKFRERIGLNKVETTRLTGISGVALLSYEKGETAPSAYHLSVLTRLFSIDPLELGELLRLDYVTPGELRSFRTACAREGKLPLEVMRDFVRVYPEVMRQKDGNR
jgi:transcriptional regulator with XRE-family HTH domain